MEQSKKSLTKNRKSLMKSFAITFVVAGIFIASPINNAQAAKHQSKRIIKTEKIVDSFKEQYTFNISKKINDEKVHNKKSESKVQIKVNDNSKKIAKLKKNSTSNQPKTLHLKVKQQDNSWKTTSNNLDPQMAWETGDDGEPIIAQTYGDQNNIIYYRLGNVGPYAQEIQKAVDTWNSLGVISLQQAPNDQVVAMNISYDSNVQSGDTSFASTDYSYQTSGSYQHDVLNKADIHIKSNTDSSSEDQKVFVIEHEIGHALGFAHDQCKSFNPYTQTQFEYATSVMSSSDFDEPNTVKVATIPLGTREANNLREHYNLK